MVDGARHTFTATRKGDIITLHGEVVHDWSDAYDFHDGSDGWIGAPARDHGGAREFENTAEWRQTLTATFKIVDGELVPQDFVWRDLD